MIKLENISCEFDNYKILDAIDYIFEKKKYLIIGPSGVGKTTLLNIICEILKPSSGNVTSTLTTGVIFQDFKLLEDFTVKENIDIALQIQNKKHTYNNIIELLDIKHILTKLPKDISGGEKQRASIARTLALGAEMIIADEPTGNLDQENAKNIISIFNLINEHLGIGFIVSSHDSLWNEYADITLKISNGKLIC